MCTGMIFELIKGRTIMLKLTSCLSVCLVLSVCMSLLVWHVIWLVKVVGMLFLVSRVVLMKLLVVNLSPLCMKASPFERVLFIMRTTGVRFLLLVR